MYTQSGRLDLNSRPEPYTLELSCFPQVCRSRRTLSDLGVLEGVANAQNAGRISPPFLEIAAIGSASRTDRRRHSSRAPLAH
jgi:hypothetical protein